MASLEESFQCVQFKLNYNIMSSSGWGAKTCPFCIIGKMTLELSVYISSKYNNIWLVFIDVIPNKEV